MGTLRIPRSTGSGKPVKKLSPLLQESKATLSKQNVLFQSALKSWLWQRIKQTPLPTTLEDEHFDPKMLDTSRTSPNRV